MRDALPQLVVGFVVPVALFLLSQLPRRQGPAEASLSSGRIGSAHLVVIAMVISGIIFGLGGVAGARYGLRYGDTVMLVLSPLFVLFGALSAWMAAIAASPGWHVIWDADGVRGPSPKFSLRRYPAQAFIPWDAIDRLTVDQAGTRSITDANGNRIGWGHLYAGHDVFERSLAERCPHLRSDIEAL